MKLGCRVFVHNFPWLCVFVSLNYIPCFHAVITTQITLSTNQAEQHQRNWSDTPQYFPLLLLLLLYLIEKQKKNLIRGAVTVIRSPKFCYYCNDFNVKQKRWMAYFWNRRNRYRRQKKEVNLRRFTSHTNAQQWLTFNDGNNSKMAFTVTSSISHYGNQNVR